MATLKVLKGDSRRGRQYLARLARRGERVLEGRVLREAARLVERVRRGGDRALLKAVRRLDDVKARSVEELRLDPEVGADETLPPGFEAAFERAVAAVERYYGRTAAAANDERESGPVGDPEGVELGERRRPLRRVGIYVPGGRAAYPSTAVMTVVPARLAGVSEIVVATPPGSWERSPALRHALSRLGVREIWGMGGAHAVAALAYGTASVRRVDKIVGPGNAWVTAAKHLVSASVAIDGLAGPSEVVIVASAGADPERLAADLLAQAEHDPEALALLVTDDRRLAKAARKALARRLGELETAATARAALRAQGAAVVVRDMDHAREWVEAVAPEHLQLMGEEAEGLAERVRNAGAVFVGAASPVVFGDYLAGPSHVLPTAGTARFASALGIEDFQRRSHVVRYDAVSAARAAAAAACLADAEGLPAHAASARLRSGDEG